MRLQHYLISRSLNPYSLTLGKTSSGSLPIHKFTDITNPLQRNTGVFQVESGKCIMKVEIGDNFICTVLRKHQVNSKLHENAKKRTSVQWYFSASYSAPIEVSGTPTKVHQQGTALETTRHFRWNLGWRAIQLQFHFNNSRVCCVRRLQEIKLCGFNYTKDQDKGALQAESWEQSAGASIMLGGIIFLIKFKFQRKSTSSRNTGNSRKATRVANSQASLPQSSRQKHELCILIPKY